VIHLNSIDVEKLLLTLSDDAPCGEDLEYDPTFMEIEKELEGKAEQQMGDSVIEAEEPNWKVIFKDSLELLERTHDLRILLFLIRAGIRQEGFLAFSDGLTVMSGWINNQWENVYPLLDEDDDNDPTERVNTIMTLCDFGAILNPLTLMPVVESNGLGKFNFKQIQEAQHGAEEPSLAMIDAAFTDCDLEQLESRFEQITLCIEALGKIEDKVTQEVGVSHAPNLSELLKRFKEILTVLSEYITKRGGASSEAEALAGDSENLPLESLQGKPVSVGSINSSQDVTKALERIIEYYRKSEPSSPVPMLLERAKGLVSMDFMSIIKNLASDGESQVKNIRGPVEGEEDDY
jgi:type VI secretion system protein ImpA